MFGKNKITMEFEKPNSVLIGESFFEGMISERLEKYSFVPDGFWVLPSAASLLLLLEFE